jgi:hypothetical protein
MMSKEWIILYVIIFGSVVYLSNVISSLSRPKEDFGFIENSLESIQEIISKFYDNSLREDMDPYYQFKREQNPPTIYDIAETLESISNGIDYIVEKLDEINLSKND